MSCHVMSCHVMSCHVMSCHTLRSRFIVASSLVAHCIEMYNLFFRRSLPTSSLLLTLLGRVFAKFTDCLQGVDCPIPLFFFRQLLSSLVIASIPFHSRLFICLPASYIMIPSDFFFAFFVAFISLIFHYLSFYDCT